MSGLVFEWMGGWVGGWVGGWLGGWVGQWLGRCVSVWTSDRSNERAVVEMSKFKRYAFGAALSKMILFYNLEESFITLANIFD